MKNFSENFKSECTKISNGIHIIAQRYGGWTADTSLTVDGQDWNISTSKRSRGIICTATKVDRSKNGLTMISFSNMSQSETLASDPGNATKNKIQTVHLLGLCEFVSKYGEADETDENGESVVKKEKAVKPGQIVFLNGYGQDEHHHEKKAIYKIESDKYAKTAFWVNLETLKMGTDHLHHIRPISEKFGIGTYYVPGETMPMDELLPIVEKAEKLAAEKAAKARIEREQKDAERARKIEEGKKIVKVPEWAKSVIVADFKEDKSDLMTDYFGCITVETVFLAWSGHTRDIFSEMRKAAENFDETKFLSDDTEEGKKKYEHRQKYSMGAGYFLGESRYSGWNVSKESINVENERQMEKIYIAAAEGRFYCKDEKPTYNQGTTYNDGATATERAAADIGPIDAEGIQIAKYNERTGVIYGNTYPIRKKLGRDGLGCKFNKFLTIEGKKQPGWVFNLSRMDEIREALNLQSVAA